jgi:hypothetical protein
MTLIRLRNIADLSLPLSVLGFMFMALSIPQVGHGLATRSNSQEAEITFKSMGAGGGQTEDGSEYEFAWLKSSDGVVISARTEKRRSVARARAVLRRTLRGAEIVEWSTKINKRGRTVGQRVIARVRVQDQRDARYIVLWTDGSDFHYLDSLSLRHLLLYEKMYP